MRRLRLLLAAALAALFLSSCQAWEHWSYQRTYGAYAYHSKYTKGYPGSRYVGSPR